MSYQSQGGKLSYLPIDTAALGDSVVVPLVAGKRIKVASWFMISAGAVNARWKSGAGTSLSGLLTFAANTGVSIAGTGDSPLMQTSPGEALVLNLSGAIVVGGTIAYYVEPD